MNIFGRYTSNYPIKKTGFKNLNTVYMNNTATALYQMAIELNEGKIAKGGAFVVKTGIHTGRSATDKFIVHDATTEKTVWWDTNQSISINHFNILHQDFINHTKNKNLFLQDLFIGADKKNMLSARIFVENSWHALFIQHLLREGTKEQLENFIPDITVINLPSFKASPNRHGCKSETIIACDFTRKIILIGGTSYAGEIKKSIFSILNFLLPSKKIMPMHCSVNIGKEGPAIFFGLSGTGKTTLSADKDRVLIGDDEHGWSKNGIFNFEGGCYAKVINLSKKTEPEIFSTTQKFATILENVVIDPTTRILDFNNKLLTENTRGAYPLTAISNVNLSGISSSPKNIILLTADAFGVLPPIAQLTLEQTIYYFLSGYTAKIAGTEKGIIEPEATFSTCFGQPFMPCHPNVYGDLLQKLIKKNNVRCWLINTGWTGGSYGIGNRIPIKITRTLLNAALSGKLNNTNIRIDKIFNFKVPIFIKNINQTLLTPRKTWINKDLYDIQAKLLANMFHKNFIKYEKYVSKSILNSGPKR